MSKLFGSVNPRHAWNRPWTCCHCGGTGGGPNHQDLERAARGFPTLCKVCHERTNIALSCPTCGETFALPRPGCADTETALVEALATKG